MLLISCLGALECIYNQLSRLMYSIHLPVGGLFVVPACTGELVVIFSMAWIQRTSHPHRAGFVHYVVTSLSDHALNSR